MAVLVLTPACVEMKICQHGKIALQIDPVALPVAVDGNLAGNALLLKEIVPVLPAQGDDMPVPQGFGELQFRAPPIAPVLLG